MNGDMMGRYAVLVLAIGLMALAGCGRRERVTTVTTIETVTPAPLTSGGVAGASASGFAPADGQSTNAGTAGQGANGSAANGQVAASGSARTPSSRFVRRQRLALSTAAIGLGGAAATEYAGTAPWGLADANGSGVAASGQQCSNPFGGSAATVGQGICSDQGEHLACQCTDDGCQLFHTSVMACAPTGAVVN